MVMSTNRTSGFWKVQMVTDRGGITQVASLDDEKSAIADANRRAKNADWTDVRFRVCSPDGRIVHDVRRGMGA